MEKSQKRGGNSNRYLSKEKHIDIPLNSNTVVFFNANLIQHRQCQLVAPDEGVRHFNYATYANWRWFSNVGMSIFRYGGGGKKTRVA